MPTEPKARDTYGYASRMVAFLPANQAADADPAGPGKEDSARRRQRVAERDVEGGRGDADDRRGGEGLLVRHGGEAGRA
jgi:hypothetical protein